MPDNALKYLSICSGIEAATVAWHPLGWQPVGFSEIDPFARAVLAHRYPGVPLHGDFTNIDAGAHGAIDLLVGGTPCQSFSIAGLRKGLADDRGNLTLEFIRLAKRARPRWLVWENVPGVLSIDGGRTFGTFLGGLAECGYGFAYRILDAQYFGVPQRRRRVFVVGHLGDWRPAAAVLFERESLQRDITPGREARERIADSLTVGANQCSGRPGDFVEHVAYALEASTGGASGKEGRGLITADIASCLETTCNDYSRADGFNMVAHSLRGEGFDASEDGTGRGVPLVPETPIAFSSKDYGADAAENAPTLRAMGHDKSHANAGGQIAIAIPLQEIGKRTGKSTDDASIGVGIGHDGDAMFTLQAASQHGVAAFEPGSIGRNAGPAGLSDTCSTLRAEMGDNQPAILGGMAVRRLTPRECERLQGFPDDYTLIPYRGRPAADGPRYKALGNSMAVPVMRWLGERIQEIDSLAK